MAAPESAPGDAFVHARVQLPAQVPDLLVQILKLGAWKFELRDLRQHYIPTTLLDVRHKVLKTVHGVQRYLALILQA